MTRRNGRNVKFVVAMSEDDALEVQRRYSVLWDRDLVPVSARLMPEAVQREFEWRIPRDGNNGRNLAAGARLYEVRWDPRNA